MKKTITLFLIAALVGPGQAALAALPYTIPAPTALPAPTPGQTDTPGSEDSPVVVEPLDPAATPTPSVQPAPQEPAAPSPPPQEQNPAYTINIQYPNAGLYPTWEYYYVALRSTKVYKQASATSAAIGTIGYGGRVESAEKTETINNADWLKVTLADGQEGYVDVANGRARSFRLDRAWNELLNLEKEINQPFTIRMSNYQNAHGLPAAVASGAFDERGNRREMAASCYARPDSGETPLCYAPDGMLGIRYEQYNGFTRVYFPTFGEYYWVPDKYVADASAVRKLEQVIIIDRDYQNTIMFELNAGGEWEIVGMNYVSTGKKGGSSLETPLGYYAAIEKKPYFRYDNEGDGLIDGYALHVIRFSGGGYTHGVPAGTPSHAYNEPTPIGGSAEGMSSLGTTPQSHMCIRNYTSYALFMKDRAKIGACAFIIFGDEKQ